MISSAAKWVFVVVTCTSNDECVRHQRAFPTEQACAVEAQRTEDRLATQNRGEETIYFCRELENETRVDL